MVINNPKILAQYVRDGLVEQEHRGFILYGSVDDIRREGEDKDYPYYLRSCAKPLQASLIIDFGLDEFYKMREEEIAICCASHAGEMVHVDIAKRFLKKIGLDESYLKCGLHKPISKTEQNKLLIAQKNENIFQNNCVGKHIMMLGICKMKGWDLKTYDEFDHPLQVAIKNKIYELCEVKGDFPVTKDGCGVPIMSMPLENMLKGYLNLFCDKRYEKIKNSFLNNPYIIGGQERTDTKIMSGPDNLVAKVGAGGILIVINPDEQQGVLVKISDCDMKARELVMISTLNALNWADIPIDVDIKTLHGEIIGKIVT